MAERELTTYENDKDWIKLYLVNTTDEMILEFIFKKGGRVNVTNMNSLMRSDGRLNTSIPQHILNLQQKELIEPDGSHYYKITKKAKWERFRDYKGWMFWTFIASFLILLLTIILVIIA